MGITMNQTFELFLSGTEILHQYKVSTPMPSDAGTLVEDFFELRSDSVELTMLLSALAKTAFSGEKSEDDLPVQFGQRIYKLLFSGLIGECWQECRNRAGDNALALVLRIDPLNARFLQRIPWEYLHDGKDFLSTNWLTPIYRLPSNIKSTDFELLKEPLRMLVVIAAPVELSKGQMLNFSREEDLILAATSEARKAGKLHLEFTPNGAPETLEQYLREYNPHLLHFVGHSVFVDSVDSGMLLMETPDGHSREVWNKDFADVLVENGRELRGVFLSACQSAVAPRVDGFADLAPRLLTEGIPVVTAMQHSILDASAMAFGSAFYKGIAEGRLIEDTFTGARQVLRKISLNNVDFATPVLFLSDPGCLQVDPLMGGSVETPMDLSGLTKAQEFVGRTIEIRELQTKLDPQSGTWRAAVIHGIGGMGKTVLATRLAERMAPQLDGVISLRLTLTTTAQNVLDHIGDFLVTHNAKFNLSEIHDYQQTQNEALDLNIRIGMLTQILQKLRLLMIFDNCEDILPKEKKVSHRAQDEHLVSPDPEILTLIASLIGNQDDLCRFLFTSRVDFSPVEENHLVGAVGHLALKDMNFREAVYLMETLPPLESLPVVILNPIDGSSYPQPVTMGDIFQRLGGHPYRLNLFAKQAQRSSITQVMDDVSGLQKELLEFTLLEKTVERLSERAALLLRRVAVYEEPVPIEGLAFMLGDEQNAMPNVAAEFKELLHWGLVAPELGSEDYSIHCLVRDWAHGLWSEEERKAYLCRAALYWVTVGEDNQNLWDHLRARQYFYQAGEYEEADDIVQAAYDYLLRWGHLALLLSMLRESVETLEGKSKAIALGNLGTILMSLGDYRHAKEYYQQVLPLFADSESRLQKAATLHQLGNLHYLQGEYGESLTCYQQSLEIRKEIEDRGGMAKSLHQIGMLHQAQGEYDDALGYYKQSLKIKAEINDRSGEASSLHAIGYLHQAHGEYDKALGYYQQSREILVEIGDRAGLSTSLHQIGMLHQRQGEYKDALEYYQQSLEIKEEIGDRAGVAKSLHQIGMLHHDQGEYREAQRYYQRSLKIKEEIGDQAGVAKSLHQIGMLHQDKGDYEEALRCYQQSLKIKEEIGDQAALSTSLHQIGMMHQQQGEYEEALRCYQQSLMIDREMGDQAGVSTSLHQIGMLHQDKREYEEALEHYQQSLKIDEEIGDQEGAANNFGQLGLLYEQTDQMENAIQASARAFLLFSGMGLPQAGEIKQHLKRLHSKVGNEIFHVALRGTNLPTEAQTALSRALEGNKKQSDSK
jgi:tetratricopeptide (TPR) repeat protein